MNALLIVDKFNFLNEDVCNLLQKKGINTVQDFLQSDNRLIERISSLTYPEIGELKKYITKSFSATPLNGIKYYQKILACSAIIPTGIIELDDLLQGGLYTGNIYEICGPPSSGKTHLISAVIRNVLPDNTIYFLDTKKEFSGKYMKYLLNKSNKNENCLQLMNKILVKEIGTKYDLISALFDIKKDLEKGLSARIIIIHYLPTLFLNTNDITENNNILNHLANILRYITHQYHTVVIITNLTTTWIDGNFKHFNGIMENIACGKYWRTIPNVRLKLDREKDNIFKFTLFKYNNVIHKTYCYTSQENICI